MTRAFIAAIGMYLPFRRQLRIHVYNRMRFCRPAPKRKVSGRATKIWSLGGLQTLKNIISIWDKRSPLALAHCVLTPW